MPTAHQKCIVLEILDELENPSREAVEAAFDAAGWQGTAASRRQWLRKMGLHAEAAALVVRPKMAANALTRAARLKATSELVVQLENQVEDLRTNVRSLAKVVGHMRMWLQKGCEPILPDDLRRALAALQVTE